MSTIEELSDIVKYHPTYVVENYHRCIRLNELIKQEAYNTPRNRRIARWASEAYVHSKMLKPLYHELSKVEESEKRDRLIKLFHKINKHGFLEKYKQKWDAEMAHPIRNFFQPF